MASGPNPRIVLPKPGIPRVIGLLNITFGSILLLYGLCSGVSALLLPTMFSRMEVFKKAPADSKAKRASEIAELLEKEKAATTETEKAELKNKRLDLEDQADTDEMTESISTNAMGGTKNPILMGVTLADVVSAMILNVLMIVAGVGLMKCQEWGRKLGIWVAGIKIVRLVAVAWVSFAVVMPISTTSMLDMSNKMEETQRRQAARRGRPPAQVLVRQPQNDMAKMMTVAGTASAVGLVVIGSIYPAISIWLLSTDGARAACLPRAKPKPESNEL
jgi:hypothetical protein